MKHLLLIIATLFFAQALHAEEMQSSGYVGVGSSHINAEGGNTNSQMLYAGFAAGYADDPDVFRTEFQLEKYKADPFDVTQFGFHIMPAASINRYNQIYIDLGINVARFELNNQHANQTFGSYGIGYRVKVGPLSAHISYGVDNLKEIDGVKIDKPKRTVVGIDYRF